MKPISIDTQNIILLIPVLNCTVPAAFLYNSFVLYKPLGTELRGLLRMTCAALPVHVLFRLLVWALPTAKMLLQFLSQYLVCFICARVLIKFQEKW